MLGVELRCLGGGGGQMGTSKSFGDKPADGSRWEELPLSAADSNGIGMSAGGLDPQRLARLMRTIEGEIVPRLIMSRRLKAATVAPVVLYNDLLDELDVKEFVRLLLAHEPGVASAYVQTVRSRGATLEAVCLDLLAPAARELGLLWEEDECDFMQVTVGLCRLHQVLRELSPAFECNELAEEGDRGILLVSYPGEQHTFGVTLVAQFLRRAGWEVTQGSPTSVAELLVLARQSFFALIGVSVGFDRSREELAETIRAIREQSRNRRIGVLVGGPLFVAHPELAASIGADATASNGRDAVHQAERICDRGWRQFSAARK
jgi:MerR family transcriptional regulator, light-induced transcriptional regulator